MGIRRWLGDRSPRTQLIFGAVLGVGLTVIVVGFLFLQLNALIVEPAPADPQASFEYEFRDDGTVVVTHDGGDTLEMGENARSVVIVSSDPDAERLVWIDADTETDRIRHGDSSPPYDYGAPGSTVRVVWVSVTNESASTLASQEAPEPESPQRTAATGTPQ